MGNAVEEHHRDNGDERTEGGDFDAEVVVRPVHEAFEAHREGEAERHLFGCKVRRDGQVWQDLNTKLEVNICGRS